MPAAPEEEKEKEKENLPAGPGPAKGSAGMAFHAAPAPP